MGLTYVHIVVEMSQHIVYTPELSMGMKLADSLATRIQYLLLFEWILSHILCLNF